MKQNAQFELLLSETHFDVRQWCSTEILLTGTEGFRTIIIWKYCHYNDDQSSLLLKIDKITLICCSTVNDMFGICFCS